jgi:glycosyltransferase involved in cell wall biosynthesis
MLAAMESARAAGADVAPLDHWRREADFDLMHFWGGMGLDHGYTVKWAHAGGKKTVLTALVDYPGWKSWLRHQTSLLVGLARLLKPMLATLDCITVVNEAQAKFLIGTVKFPAEKLAVVPNLVEDIFFEKTGTTSGTAFGVENYVLCVGNVCRRKNQLSLIAACHKLGVPLLLVGNALTGEEEYGQVVSEAISGCPGSGWIPWLSPGSRELASAYRDARVFALLSRAEQQPISALEAAAMRKPLVLADRPWARQEFYEHAALADSRSVDAIAGALRKALDNPEAHCPPASVLQQCRKERVGAAYMAVYQRLVN